MDAFPPLAAETSTLTNNHAPEQNGLNNEVPIAQSPAAQEAPIAQEDQQPTQMSAAQLLQQKHSAGSGAALNGSATSPVPPSVSIDPSQDPFPPTPLSPKSKSTGINNNTTGQKIKQPQQQQQQQRNLDFNSESAFPSLGGPARSSTPSGGASWSSKVVTSAAAGADGDRSGVTSGTLSPASGATPRSGTPEPSSIWNAAGDAGPAIRAGAYSAKAGGRGLAAQDQLPGQGQSYSGRVGRGGGGGRGSNSQAAAAAAHGLNGPHSNRQNFGAQALASAAAFGHVQTFALPIDSLLYRPGVPPPPGQPSLSDVLKGIIRKSNSNVMIESSSSISSGLMTFVIKGRREEDVKRGRMEVVRNVGKKITIQVPVPSSLLSFIIGTKGRTLKSITESSGAQVQIPKRQAPQQQPDEQVTSPGLDESGAEAVASAAAAGQSNPDEDTPVQISIYGDDEGVNLAKSKIEAIVNERLSKIAVRIGTDRISPEFYPLLNGARGSKGQALIRQVCEEFGESFAAPAEGEEGDAIEVGPTETGVLLYFPTVWRKAGGTPAAGGQEAVIGEEEKERELAIVINGDRKKVDRLVELIEHEHEELKRRATTLNISVPKRQHRFLVGSNAEDILEATGCSVEIPTIDDPSDQVTIRGYSEAMPTALTKVMEKANATLVDTVDLSTAHKGNHDQIAYTQNFTRYCLRRSKLRPIQDAHSVQIYLPRVNTSATKPSMLIEIVGKSRDSVEAARKDVIATVKKFPPVNFLPVEIDSLVHRHLIGKKGQRIKNFEEKKGVDVVFPPLDVGGDEVLLVFSDQTVAEEAKKTAVLEEVQTELAQMAKEAADITTVILDIPQKLHRAVVGQGGTTLNAVIGEEKAVIVRFGSQSQKAGATQGGNRQDNLTEDQVLIRGPSEEVARVRQAIEKIAEEARHNDVINSYTADFEVDARFVSHLVGRSGAGINKLRDELGVRVDFADPVATGKRKPKVQVTVKGRKENAEEAKKRIISQVDRLADETTLTIPMPFDDAIDRGSLIGKGGMFLKKLETKYEVRVNFPSREDRFANGDGDHLSTDIVIRGPKKGAESAKQELVELIAHEREHGQRDEFVVPDKAVPRILGKNGASINQIKDDTDAQIDLDRIAGANETKITVRGTKQAITKAKNLILAISKEAADEVVVEIPVERSLHVSLIGAGGSNIRDLVTKCGGPSDGKSQGALVRFPRHDDPADVITLRGPKALIQQVQAELEKQISDLRNRVVYGASVPRALHPGIIGRQGSSLQELQRKHAVNIVMPGWKTHASVGDVVNADELGPVEPGDLVKILGPRPACEAAAAEMKSKGRAQQVLSKTVSVPTKYHHRIGGGGRFFRALPVGVKIDHANVPLPPQTALPRPFAGSNGVSAKAAVARIDEDDDEDLADSQEGFKWDIQPFSNETDEGDIPWVITSNNESNLAATEKLVLESLEKAKKDSHIAFLQVPSSVMGLVIGKGGAGLDKIRAQADVQVDVVGKRGSDTLSFVGVPENLEKARTLVIELASSGRRERGAGGAGRPPRR